jgi:hypothetical protein
MSKKPEARRITKSRPILTLEQRVDEALRIIGKVRGESDFATMHRMADINAVVDQMSRRLELWNQVKPAAAARQKRFAEEYGLALRKVIAFTEKTTPDFRAPPWPLHVSANHLGIDQELFDHEHLLRHLRLLHWICECWAKSKWGKSQPSAEDKRLAANGALLLCEKFGLPLSTTRKTGENTQASVFCRLAATLYGDPDANLQPCRAALAMRKAAGAAPSKKQAQK